MALTEKELAELLIKFKTLAPNVYRHIMGVIVAVAKIMK